MENMKSTNFIRYNPERIDYTLTGEELEQLQNIINNNWKDFCIGTFAIGIPCIINAVSEINKQQKFIPTISFNINLVIGILGLSLGIIFLILWQNSKKQVDTFISKIKNKPKISVIQNNLDINQMVIDLENISEQKNLK